MDPQAIFSSPLPSPKEQIFHLLCGSFKSLSLYLLAFSPFNRTLSLVHQTKEQFGPHQYLAYNQAKGVAYSTSWAEPAAILSSWEVRLNPTPRVNHLQNVNITAVSSYIAVPPPFWYVYSVGGPTGEVHSLDGAGGFGEKVQEILFVPEDELEKADKSRKALRTGSHAIEFSPSTSYAFVPVLGTSTIKVYTHDKVRGILTHIYSSPSPRGNEGHDGPRHIKIHPNGRVLYSVTEHSNFLDIYDIIPTSESPLKYVASRSIIPDNLRNTNDTQKPAWRGDTLALLPSTSSHPIPSAIFTTTRGGDSSVRGWISVFGLDANGYLSSPVTDSGEGEGVERYETPTSGGKANAIELLTKGADGEGVWIALTDDSDPGEPALRILEWDGWDAKKGIKEVAVYPSPNTGKDDGGDDRGDAHEMRGASHAIWV